MALIDDVKTALRLSASAYDDEVSDLISAAQEALVMGGVSAAAATAATAAPVKQAIILYCKAGFGLDNPDSEKYERSFWLLVGRLVLSAEYQQPIMTGLTGSITEGSAGLTVSDIDNIAADTWLSVEGAGADGALLIVQVTATDTTTLIATLSRVAGATVTTAAVRLL